MKKKLYYIYLVILTALVAGCQDEAMFTAEDDGLVTVSYQVKVGDDLQSRAIGDGMQVNELIVGVFQNNTQIKQYTSEVENGTASINIPLLKTETYDLVFWAHNKDNEIYGTSDLSNITIDYSKYNGISLVETEAFEAFSTVRRVVNLTDTEGTDITLTRPFAQINVAASEEELVADGNSVNFTISEVYTKYNLLTGEAVGEAETQNFSFAISEDDITTGKQQISISGTNYYYLASAYLFAPVKVALTGGIYKGQDLEKELDFPELPLAANTRTNIYGDMVQQEVIWDGKTFTFPTDKDLKCEVTAGDLGFEESTTILHIDTPSELAYCMREGYPSDITAIHICSHLDMGSWDWDELPVENASSRTTTQKITPQSVPAGVTIVGGTDEEGNPYSISNMTISSSALFGDTESVTIKNLCFNNIKVKAGSSHGGVLVGTLIGNSSIENVLLDGCTVKTEGAAGGMIGHIVRKTPTSRAETLMVNINGCRVSNTTLTSDSDNRGSLSAC